MKKTVSLLLTLALLLGTCLFVFAADTFHGDVNGDGAVNADDLTKLARVVAGIEDPTTNTDPVIIIPGVIGSELTVGDHTVWPPELGSDIASMFRALEDMAALNVNENPSFSPVRFCMKDRNGRNVGAQNTYETLAEALAEARGAENVFFYGYDWRLSNAVTADDLASYINAVLRTTGAKKVNIVAHSMGGIVTTGYLAKYGDAKLNKVVTCGTPFLGSEESVDALVDGGDLLERFVEDQALSALLAPLVVENARTMPSMYELMPADGWEQLGLLDGDKLVATANDTEKQAFAFYQSVLCNLEKVWKGVDHVGLVGISTETEDGDGTSNGDGRVTARSATADGLFVTESVTFPVLHVDLVCDPAAVAFILSAVSE